MYTDSFENRHNGPSGKEVEEMLYKIGVGSIDELIDQTIPKDIRLKEELDVCDAQTEYEYLNELKTIASKNKVVKNYIGMGYHETILPPVIQRNILENPGWYTAYTPYQAEISQGRLEALLNFQTMVIDLVGLPIANASLLDEATAAAEAMIMIYNNRSRDAKKKGANLFFIDSNVFPQTIEVLKTRAEPLGIELKIGKWKTFDFEELTFGALLQYPNMLGEITDYSNFCLEARKHDVAVAMATDLMALTLLKSPGELGADVAFGNSQRFGVPMGYGGPHAAFFAAKEDYKRMIPGRIIGVSQDAEGNNAYRMALQTREQHIKREKATSNICTAQALLAIMAGMYAVYHGAEGLKGIASRIHSYTLNLAKALSKLGYKIENKLFFDTINVKLPKTISQKEFRKAALKNGFNFNYIDDKVTLSIGEPFNKTDFNNLYNFFAGLVDKLDEIPKIKDGISLTADSVLNRTSPYLKHPVFKLYRSETNMMRYMKRLENKDLSLTHSMISLGSCTMKLNAAAELYPITWPEFANIHPFAPEDQTKGYHTIIKKLDKYLSTITGFAAVSFQPNSGAQGEYAGLMVIRAYHQSRGEAHRNVALIPSSAHGTNPASAAMAGMQIVIVKCDDLGNIDVEDLKVKAEEHANNLSCLMVTYPSTHGVYEEGIKEITSIVHQHGGQVYMDGANMNAQVGLTNPGNIGADVCHLNLHKTFAIPHGGGGPGMGPIGVAKHLVPFLPFHINSDQKVKGAISAVSAAPFSSALILLISYGYIKMLGSKGLTNATKMAILNANYMKSRLEEHFPILFSGRNGRVAHEMILDCREFKRTANIEVADIAKRLMDYGFHAPTVAFPVNGTLMVEPTESESLAELDRFCDAMIAIKEEIKTIESGKLSVDDNMLKNAPHTSTAVMSVNWDRAYSRETAVFPLKWVKNSKFWPSVARVDNASGDRNLICACPPLEAYEEPIVA